MGGLGAFNLNIGCDPVSISGGACLASVSRGGDFVSLRYFCKLRVFRGRGSALFLGFGFGFKGVADVSGKGCCARCRSVSSSGSPCLHGVGVSSLGRSVRALCTSVPVSLRCLVRLDPSGGGRPMFLSVRLKNCVNSQLCATGGFGFATSCANFCPRCFKKIRFSRCCSCNRCGLGGGGVGCSMGSGLDFLSCKMRKTVNMLTSVSGGGLLGFGTKCECSFRPVLGFGRGVVVSASCGGFRSAFRAGGGNFRGVCVKLS